ncbi:MAG: hypothetical protein IJ634_04020 [Bacteroidales bacterium]|nr:hypothetical protein [Bacteroidales bacterium]
MSSIKTVSFEELNLTNKDYDILARVEASARIEVTYGNNNSWTAKDPEGMFELKVTKNAKNDSSSVSLTGIVHAGYLGSQNGYYLDRDLDRDQPGDLALHVAVYRLIDIVKRQGGDGIIEPVISTVVEGNKRGTVVTYITTVSGKPIRLKSAQ